MNANAKTHLIEIPVGGKGGEIWNRLHSEREDICEVMLRDCKSTSGATGEASCPPDLTTAKWRRELLQARLRKIDAALDRLMSVLTVIAANVMDGLETTNLNSILRSHFVAAVGSKTRTRLVRLV